MSNNIDIQNTESTFEVVSSPAAEIHTSIENPEFSIQVIEDDSSLNIIEITNADSTDVSTTLESVEIFLDVVSEGPRGPQGPQGPPGIDGRQGIDGKRLEYDWQGTKLGVRIEGETEFQYQDLIGKDTFIWDQPRAESVWEFSHPMSKYPAVSIVDSAGSLVHGDVEYLSESRIKITFSSGFSGKAYLN